MSNKKYYALSDSFTGDMPVDYTDGFANRKEVIWFSTAKKRADWLESTKLLTARKITRQDAIAYADWMIGVGGNPDLTGKVAREYKTLDYKSIFEKMEKPAFIFDGRNILDHKKLFEIGFNVYPLGMPHLIHFKEA